MKKYKSITNENVALPLPVVNSSSSFPEAFERFTKFEHVKVAKDLKNEFQQYITEQIRERNIWFWSAECSPLATCYKFKRTS